MQEQGARNAVLVVDDEDVIRYSLKRALTKAGFEVREAASGQAALDALAERPAGVVLTDIRMPGMSGLELLRQIKSRDPAAEVLIMTAFADSAVAEESLSLGASAVLVKPFSDISLVTDTVAKALARVQAGRGERPGLGPDLEIVLRQSGLASDAQLAEARRLADESGKTFREAVLSAGILTEDELDWTVSNYLDVPYVRINQGLLDPDLIRTFPARLAWKHKCLPLFKSADQIHLVTVVPISPDARAEIARELGAEPVFSMGHKGELTDMIAKLYGGYSPDRLAELAARISDETLPERGKLLKELIALAEFADPLAVKLTVDDDGMEIELKGRIKPIYHR